MIRTVAVLVLLVGAIIFGIEALLDDIRGQGLKLIAIAGSVAAIFIISQHSIRKKLLSGTLMDDNEGLTYNTTFTGLKATVDGNIKGTITAPELSGGKSGNKYDKYGRPKW